MFPSPGIGDILTICQLVVKIGTVIWDITTNDVPKEFQELKEELRVLWEVLQSLKNIDDTPLSLDATIALQRIQREAKSCEEVMNDFLKNNSPPESKTRRAVWMVRVTKKAALLKEKLSVHRQNLGVFWNEFRHQQQADCNKKQNDTLNQLLVLVTEQSTTSNGQSNVLSRLLALGQNQIANSNVHTDALSQLRSMAIEQAASLDLWRKELQILRPIIQGVTLVDAIGERMEIPFLFCRTYDLLSDVLLAIFKNENKAGRKFVLRGDYNLVYGEAKDIISSSEWMSLLKPDLTVEMSMILRRTGAPTDICPRCQTSFYGDASSGWATCLQCGAQFQIKQQIEEIEESTNESRREGEISTPLAGGLPQETASSSGPHSSQQEGSLQPEWALFRLLSIVSTVFKVKPQGLQFSLAQTPGNLPLLPIDSESFPSVLEKSPGNTSNMFKIPGQNVYFVPYSGRPVSNHPGWTTLMPSPPYPPFPEPNYYPGQPRTYFETTRNSLYVVPQFGNEADSEEDEDMLIRHFPDALNTTPSQIGPRPYNRKRADFRPPSISAPKNSGTDDSDKWSSHASVGSSVSGRSVRWTDDLVAPTPPPSRSRPKGWFNRRGDQLWCDDGRFKPALQDYPPYLRDYPDFGEGWMNEHGVRISMTHRRIPEYRERLPKGVLKNTFSPLNF